MRLVRTVATELQKFMRALAEAYGAHDESTGEVLRLVAAEVTARVSTEHEIASLKVLARFEQNFYDATGEWPFLTSVFSHPDVVSGVSIRVMAARVRATRYGPESFGLLQIDPEFLRE